MKALFGAKKKEVPKEPAPTLQDSSAKLGDRQKVVQTKVDECNKQLVDIKNQMKTAKGMAYKSLQQKALHVLRRRKMYDQQLGNVMNQQFNIDQVQFTSESIASTIDTMAALKEATAVQQAEMKKLDMNKMEDLFDDLADMMADQEEIQEVMSRSYQVEYDESALLDELAELDEEIVNEQLSDGFNVPSYVPKQGTGAAANKVEPSEEDQLKNMMQI